MEEHSKKGYIRKKELQQKGGTHQKGIDYKMVGTA